MTPTIAVADETRAALAEVHSRDRLLGNRSDVASTVSDDLVERGRARLRNQQGVAAVQRAALLGVLLARLENVPFEAVAEILRVKPGRLEKMMHGEESIPSNVEKRWTLIAESLSDVHAVVKPSATWKWFNLSVPALAGKTPFDLVRKGQGPEILREFTQSYADESFS